MRKLVYFVLFVVVFFVSCLNITNNNSKMNNKIVQYSTINALLQGYYEGEMEISELQKQGNLGLGTFNDLDGEMVIIDGLVYKVKSDGSVLKIEKPEKTPFAVVTNFSADTTFNVSQKFDLVELEKFLETKLISNNLYYAIKIYGKFDFIKARSVPKQNKPYPKLIEASKQQGVFEYNSTIGYLIGFWFPDYMQDINVPGFHLHFISDDKTKGGHLLNCKTDNIKIEISNISGFQIILPTDDVFAKMNLQSSKLELDTIERDR